MLNKKLMLLMSFVLAAFLVIGGTAFASPIEGNGMMNMINGNGMSNMMEAMNSPQGQEMIDGCQDFMSSYDD
ncbi:hypothetical protein CR203_04150 [Salipaludibacillus neizhouensis]|uniref:FAD/FMN-containing dehydrogenase n=1 Tax=Salipaludibacillus neizhouensis TaxID=885475 RepID=A0A3A9KF72_9BACI|nr:hypothetical protein [Salipaludibacillus neizhouensis]RKL69231.1 hypothetical protein CR203_04150 [Salipaludibacillus neizhouensis]